MELSQSHNFQSSDEGHPDSGLFPLVFPFLGPADQSHGYDRQCALSVEVAGKQKGRQKHVMPVLRTGAQSLPFPSCKSQGVGECTPPMG